MNFSDYFINTALPKGKNRLLLLADGGFGKTTSLKYTVKKLLAIQNVVPVYIDAKNLSDSSVIDYIVREFCGEDAFDNKDKIFDILQNHEYRYAIFIDSLNEVEENVRNKVVFDFCSALIGNKSEYKNVFIVLGTRTESEYTKKSLSELGYQTIRLQAFSQEKTEGLIKAFLSPTPHLVKILSNPMMMAIFLKSQQKENYGCVQTQAELLDIYFKEQLEVFQRTTKYTEAQKLTAQYIIDVFLPEFFKAHEGFIFTIESIYHCVNSFQVDENSIFKSDFFARFVGKINLDYATFEDFTVSFLELFSKKESSLTIHQIYADYFCAKWYQQAIDNWLMTPSEKPNFAFEHSDSFDYHLPSLQVRKSIYELIGETIKQEIPAVLRHNAFESERYIIAFLVEVLRSANNFKNCDLSNLSLEYCDFRNQELENIDISHSLVTKNNFAFSFERINQQELKVIQEFKEYVFLFSNGALFCIHLTRFSINLQYIIDIDKESRIVVNQQGILIGRDKDLYIYDLHFGFLKRIVKNIFTGEQSQEALFYDAEVEKFALVGRQAVKVLDRNFTEICTVSCAEELYFLNANGKILCFENAKIYLLNLKPDGVEWQLLVQNSTSNRAFLAFMENTMFLGYQKEETNQLVLFNCSSKKAFELERAFSDVVPFVGYYKGYSEINILDNEVHFGNEISLADVTNRIDSRISSLMDELVELLCEDELLKHYALTDLKKAYQNEAKPVKRITTVFVKDNQLKFTFIYDNKKRNIKVFDTIIQLHNQRWMQIAENRIDFFSWSFRRIDSQSIRQKSVPLLFYQWFSEDAKGSHERVYLAFDDFDIDFDLTEKQVAETGRYHVMNAVPISIGDGLILSKENRLQFDSITQLPRQLHLCDAEGNIIKHVNADALQSDLMEQSIYFNALFGETIIATISGMIYEGCPINIKKLFEDDSEYLKNHKDELSDFSLSDYNRKEVIRLIRCHYDVEKGKLIIDEDLTDVIEPRLHLLLPAGYLPLSENEFFFATKTMKTDFYRFGIYERKNACMLLCQEIHCPREQYVKVLKQDENVFVVFSNSVFELCLESYQFKIYHGDQTIHAITKGTDGFYVIYDNSKLGKLVLGKEHYVISHITGIYPQLNINNSKFDDLQELHQDTEFITDLKWYFNAY